MTTPPGEGSAGGSLVPVAPEVMTATETWFRKRGLPYFVPEERAAARSALTMRAMLPLLLAVGLAALLLGGILTWRTSNASFGPGAVTFLGLLAAGFYAVTRLRARPIVTFAVHRTVSGLGQLFPMATRALPLLLVFITFLFINAEVWMLSASLDGALLWLTVLLFAVVAVAFLLVRLPEEVDVVDDRIDAPLLVSASRGTPMAEAAGDLVTHHGDELDLQRDAEVRGFERGNLIVVLLVIQAAQVLLLALAVFVFFLVFGALTMKKGVQEAWIGGGTTTFPGLGNVSVELLQTSTFLAAFSGLYFTVYVVTDEAYRVQFFTGVLREMEKAVAVRTVYRHLCRRRDASEPAPAAPAATEDAVPTRTLPAAPPAPGNDPHDD
ncbi:hypothetical protein G7072_11800 [Nocardioides sp. HDW12B]|uniref:hypothetical protein n=1 Tax=Nocardioides sp. HDW12B TaxID=2714939 RepID=UPI001409583D|nr:hypothetical protein [Nocardioides sp. HDW12B]QIK66935.1 hypothetical protein G7072_11800 [Nocardioides sp. HDW12B]